MAEKRLEGIGGWLLVFLIIDISATVILFGLFCFFSIALWWYPDTQDYVAIVVLFIYFITMLLNSIFILNKSKESTQNIIFSLGIVTVIGILLSTIYAPALLMMGFPFLIWAVICTLYFLNSPRVKNTFVK